MVCFKWSQIPISGSRKIKPGCFSLVHDRRSASNSRKSLMTKKMIKTGRSWNLGLQTSCSNKKPPLYIPSLMQKFENSHQMQWIEENQQRVETRLTESAYHNRIIAIVELGLSTNQIFLVFVNHIYQFPNIVCVLFVLKAGPNTSLALANTPFGPHFIHKSITNCL